MGSYTKGARASTSNGPVSYDISGQVTGEQRFRGDRRCPICGGAEDDPRGQARRCIGFVSKDGKWAHCSREEHAGQVPYNPGSQAYPHLLKGKCPCGTEHSPADTKPARMKRGAFDRAYAYHDEHGQILFEAVRFKDPKSFAQRRPDGQGKWAWNLSGVRLVLYRLPELVAADLHQVVIVAEGEKDVDRLRKLGFVATCNPMGAGKWRPEYADLLVDRKVVIIPDNDKAGRDHAQQVARSLERKAVEIRILELPGLPEKGDVSDWLDRGGTVDRLNRLISEAPPWEPPGPARAEIEVTTRRHEVLEQTVKALARDPDVFSRGEMLVVVAKEEADSAKLTEKTMLTKLAGSLRISALSDAVVGCYLTRNASFYETRTDRHGEPFPIDVHPPDWLIKATASLKHWRGVRPLLAVAECPYPRPDGSLVEAEGYDRSTGTLYRPAIAFPRVPDHPTRADAQAAWERLRRPFRQFPFSSEEDEVVVLAGLLTGIARPAIDGPVTGIAINGNKAGCGKGLLVDAIGSLVYGHNVPTSGYPKEPEEAHKVKVAIALSGKPIVHFDNLEEGGTYGNSGIDSALTSSTVDDRVLGTSRNTGEIALRVTWFLSGNNLSPAKDAYRRWLPCNIVTNEERPEERRDIEIEDLRAHMLEHRGQYVHDALVILKAHALAGKPRGDYGPLGSFEAWDRIVRGAVWFATGLDCCATLRKAAEESPDRLNKIALLEGWRELPGGKEREGGVTAADALELVSGSPHLYKTLHNAFMAYGRDGKPATSRSIGNKIKGMRGNVIGGMKFVEAGLDHKVALWRVERGGSGGSGGSNSISSRPTSTQDNYVTMNGGVCEPHEDGAEQHPPDPPDPPRGRVIYTAPGYEDEKF